MQVWKALLDAIDAAGKAAMVTVVATKGSTPREAGARMVIRPDGRFTGTIGGGTLEWKAIALAQGALSGQNGRSAELRRFTLGPELGQCCGGQVDLVLEAFTGNERSIVAAFADLESAGPFATAGRIASAGVERHVASAGVEPDTVVLKEGELVEGFGEGRRPLILFGAGHVGRALVLALAPLPFRVTWVDPRPDAFPAYMPANVQPRQIAQPVDALTAAGGGTFIVIMSHSHQLDLALTAAALADERFPYVGLIGSETKRARFEKRLAAAGIPGVRIDELVCPIGVPGIDSKLPAVIAAATVAELLVRDEAVRSGLATEKPLYPQRIQRIG